MIMPITVNRQPAQLLRCFGAAVVGLVNMVICPHQFLRVDERAATVQYATERGWSQARYVANFKQIKVRVPARLDRGGE
jgi:hypothetical protein